VNQAVLAIGLLGERSLDERLQFVILRLNVRFQCSCIRPISLGIVTRWRRSGSTGCSPRRYCMRRCHPRLGHESESSSRRIKGGIIIVRAPEELEVRGVDGSGAKHLATEFYTSSVFTCTGAMGTPTRTGPRARKYFPGFPYS